MSRASCFSESGRVCEAAMDAKSRRITRERNFANFGMRDCFMSARHRATFAPGRRKYLEQRSVGVSGEWETVGVVGCAAAAEPNLKAVHIEIDDGSRKQSEQLAKDESAD